MADTRFRPTVYPLEGRDVPASGVTPAQVFQAIGFTAQVPGVLDYLGRNFDTARAGGAGQTLLTAADQSRAAAVTLNGFLSDTQEAAVATPAAAGQLNQLAAATRPLIAQALANATAAEVLAARLGVTRPVPPPPPPTGDPDNPVITPQPDQNPPGSPPVVPAPPAPPPPVSPPGTPPPSDGSQLATALPSLAAPDFRPVGTQGLRVQDVVAGTGATATATSSTTVRYRGFLASDGSSFDNNVGNGRDPLPVTIGPVPNVIQGFAQGIVGMRVGGIRTIDIPPELGYANNPPPGSGIPPNARLVFQVQLLSVS